MIKKFFFIILFIPLYNLAIAQNTIGVLSKSEGVFEGYTLFAPNFSTETYLINNCGQVVNQWTSSFYPGVSVYLLENGNLLRTGGVSESEIIIGAPGGKIELYDWDGNLLWEYVYSSNEISQHHDVFPLPNGNILMLAVTTMSQTEAVQAGRDPSKLLDVLYNEQIIELEPVGTNDANIIWEWNIKDHLIQNFDNSVDNFGVVKDHPELLNINFMEDQNGLANWLHINSIDYNESLNQIILSSKNLNEIYIIDHSTTSEEAASHTGGIYGKGGDFLYRWGNPEAYDFGGIDDKKLFGQHYAHWIPENVNDAGKIMIFNNGGSREYSSLDIINPELSAPGVYSFDQIDGFSPNASEWSYVDPTDPELFYSHILSSGQRLPNGNTLICAGESGHFFEVDQNNNTVWEYINPVNADGAASQGEVPAFNYVFRAYKFALDYPAFIGRNLVPQDPIEIDFNLSICDEIAPQAIAKIPENNSEGILVTTHELELSFDEKIQYLGGDIVIRRSEDDSAVENTNIRIEEEKLIIVLNGDFEYGSSYYVEISGDAIADFASNKFIGFSNINDWTFTTEQETILSLLEKKKVIKTLEVYPNPATNTITYSLPPELCNTYFSISIIDMKGTTLKSLHQNKYVNTSSINISKLENGVYLLKLANKDGVYLNRFLKE